jgi:hypothetical protein
MKLLKTSISILITSLLLCGNAFSKPDGDKPPLEIDVNVVNELTNPVPVKNVDPVGRLQDEILMTIASGTTGNSEPVLDVPEGKMAIVKFVSGRTFTTVDSWVSCTVVKMTGGAPIGGEGSHPVIIQKRSRATDYSHEFSQEMEFYVEGGLQAGFSCTMAPAPATDELFILTITAILVDADE